MTQQTGVPAVHPMQETRIAHVLHAIRASWLMLLVMSTVGTLGGIVSAKLTTPIYQAVSTVEFDPKPAVPLDKNDGMTQYLALVDSQVGAETQYRIMLSDHVLTRVVQDLGLATDPAFLGLKEAPRAPVPATKAAQILRAKVGVEAVRNTRLFTVKVEDSDPKRARRFCDAIVSAYMTQSAERQTVASTNAVTWLNGQVQHYRSDLEITENALHELKRRSNAPSLSINDGTNTVRLELTTFGEALSKTRTERAAVEARLAELAKTPDGSDSLPDVLAGTALASLRARLFDTTAERRQLIAEGRGGGHPAVQRLDEQIRSLEGEVREETRRLRERTERELSVVRQREARESALFEDARQRAVDLNLKEIEYRRLDRAREQNEKLYSLLLEREQQADLSRLMNVSSVRLLDSAVEPETPLRPQMSSNAALGALIGFACAVFVIFAKKVIENRVRSPEDVESRLGATYLGSLPRAHAIAPRGRRRQDPVPPKYSAELVVYEQPLSATAEAARIIRTNLAFLVPDRPWRTLLVTSALPREGKTTVGCALALAQVQAGKRVCFVDGDLRRPRLHRVFGLPGTIGLTNALVGQASVEDIIQSTFVPGLSVVAAGPIPPSPADLLHSNRLRQIVNTLTETFDCVILDSPPAALVTDAAILAAYVDGSVFVARSGAVSFADSQRGLRALTDVDARVLGVVLNDVAPATGPYSYRYENYLPEEPAAPPGGSGTATLGDGSDDRAGAH